jgi:hypothetical protein
MVIGCIKRTVTQTIWNLIPKYKHDSTIIITSRHQQGLPMQVT